MEETEVPPNARRPGSMNSFCPTTQPTEGMRTAEAQESICGSSLPVSRLQRSDEKTDDLSKQETKRDEPAGLTPLKRKETKDANKKANPRMNLGITLGGPMIVLFDIVVPIIIYYTWYNKQASKWRSTCQAWHDRGEVCPIQRPEFNKTILGASVASFGLGEIWILIARAWVSGGLPDCYAKSNTYTDPLPFCFSDSFVIANSVLRCYQGASGSWTRHRGSILQLSSWL